MSTGKRTEEYAIHVTTRTTNRKKGAILVTPYDIIQAWNAAHTDIPARFFVGVAQHETNFATNEIDTEPNGFVSEGIYQISRAEAREVGQSAADLLALGAATKVAARLMERRLATIVQAANLARPYPDDTWAYLGMSHNLGIGATLKTIRLHGLDWEAYKKRNPKLRIVSSGYGDDVISGGPHCPVPWRQWWAV